MRRVTLSEKVLEWICFLLREASSHQKNQVRRWRFKDQVAEFFGTRNHNCHGRYMSILSLNGEDRTVIIVPESDINAGWRSVAFKIQSFIKCSPQKEKTQSRTHDSKMTYAKAVKHSKWQSNSPDMVTTKGKETGTICEAKINDQGVLGRCIFGYFDKEKAENPTLSEVRRWSSTVWKKAFGINIYEMLDNCYLFEFPNRYMSEQVLQGKLCRREAYSS